MTSAGHQVTIMPAFSRYANVGLGQVKGYPQYQSVRKGQSGSDVRVQSYTYASNTDSSGATVYPVATSVAYPDAGTTATTITTSYAYTYYSGTNQLQQRTTTLPVVSTGQNGSNSADTTVEEYDTYGNLTQQTDERGIVNQSVYDVVTGDLLQRTLNYQSGVTAPGVNVVTDFTYDDQGRLLQTLGPSHTAVLSGSATTVRAAMWYVYTCSAKPSSGTWEPDENRSGRGYATGSGPGYTFTLVDPVTLSRVDKDGRTTDQISSKRTTGSGALSASDTFDQTDWKSWSSTQYDMQHRTISSRVYHLIPSSGEGSVGDNYGEADYGYDALERRNRVVSPGGTITRTVWTTPQRVASTWVGTDDTGATDSNPAGSGTPNNMVMVSENQYDGGSDGGDGNLTQVTAYAAASDTRVTSYGYDFRDRRTSADGEVDVYIEYTYDNLDRVTQTDRKDTSSGGNLIGRSQSIYDDRGRVYQQVTYAVDPSSGTVGNALTGNSWYDPSGNVLQQIAAGNSQVFSKNVYNGVGWVTATYRGYNTSGVSYSQAGTVSGDTIFSQSESTYDEAGNVISTATYDRLNDATGTGALSYGSNPMARVSYIARWYDGIDRASASGAYGVIASFTRPDTPPASSDTVLVSTAEYDDAGRGWKTMDPLGIENRTTFDAAGRTTQSVEAYDSGSSDDDTNRTTNYTYTLDNQVATMTAVNARTGDQTTTYTYGTTLSDSDVARNDLLRQTTYPNTADGWANLPVDGWAGMTANQWGRLPVDKINDVIINAYNRLGQRNTFTDQRATVHSYIYDKLGRPTDDCVTTVGDGTDSTVLRISTTYEVRGMAETITSYDDATVGSGWRVRTKSTANGHGLNVEGDTVG